MSLKEELIKASDASNFISVNKIVELVSKDKKIIDDTLLQHAKDGYRKITLCVYSTGIYKYTGMDSILKTIIFFEDYMKDKKANLSDKSELKRKVQEWIIETYKDEGLNVTVDGRYVKISWSV